MKKQALKAAVKSGVLKKGKGGGFPVKKTVYAPPAFDIGGHHAAELAHLDRAAAMDSVVRVMKHNDPSRSCLLNRCGESADYIHRFPNRRHPALLPHRSRKTKSSKRVALVCLWLAWLLARPPDTLAQGSFAYQQWTNPNPRPGVPWDDSGVWVGPGYLGAGTPLNVDMDLDGNADFQISSDGTTLGIFATGDGEVIALRSPPPDLGGSAARLPAGQSINSLAPVPCEWVESYYFYGPIGNSLLTSTTAGQLGFWGGQFGYLGVRIQKNGDWYYGWIRGGVPLSIVPEGIFYEAALNLTPNAGIFADQIPEPSSVAMSILGILLLFTRRSKSRLRL